MWDGVVSKEVFDRPFWGGEAGEETFQDGSRFFISWTLLEDVGATVQDLACGEINAEGTGGAVGLDEVLVVLACVTMPRRKLGEAAHLWARELLEPGLRAERGTKDEGGRMGLAAFFYGV